MVVSAGVHHYCRARGDADGGVFQPEKFTDIELRGTPPERTRELLLPDLERHLKKEAGRHISAGQNLQLRLTDIDDAGWIRPIGPTPRRIVRPSQPGRVDFEYALKDASGEMLASGRQTLSDLPWDRLDRSLENEQLPLIKKLMSDWIRQVGAPLRRTTVRGRCF